jgi:hypothetical protein
VPESQLEESPVKNNFLAFVLAVLVVLSGLALRKSIASIGTDPVPMPHMVAIGTDPVPMPHAVRIGTDPVPMPHAAKIGTDPVPMPHERSTR